MITNILQILHTTAAYQGAVMQLLVNEANFTAKQLDLKETVPAIVATDSARWEVDPPPEGVGGSVTSENYSFWFREGRLRSVNKLKWLQKISPPVVSMTDLAGRPSLLDTNSAYELAKERLTSLGVDVAALERKHPPNIFQLRFMKRGPDGQRLSGPDNLQPVPVFMIGWGENKAEALIREPVSQTDRVAPANRPRRPRPPSSMSPVYVHLLGTTREVVELNINDPSVFTRPALQITNADKLLGPTPPPKHFVENLFGGPEAYRTVAEPDKVELWLLTGLTANGEFQGNKDRAGPFRLTPQMARRFSDALLNFDSYVWRGSKNCIVDFGARLRFTRSNDVVGVRLCYKCDTLEITHNGREAMADFDPAHDALARALDATDPVTGP